MAHRARWAGRALTAAGLPRQAPHGYLTPRSHHGPGGEPLTAPPEPASQPDLPPRKAARGPVFARLVGPISPAANHPVRVMNPGERPERIRGQVLAPGERGDSRGAEPCPDRPGDSARPAAADRLHDRAALRAWRAKRRGVDVRWLVSLAIVVTVTVLATGNNPPKPNTAPSLAALAAKSPSGRAWSRSRSGSGADGRPKKPEKPPKWQTHVDNMSPWFAMALGPASSPGPYRRGRGHGRRGQLSSSETYLALFLFCVLASASYLALEIYAGFRPDRAIAPGQVQDLDGDPHRPGHHPGQPLWVSGSSPTAST